MRLPISLPSLVSRSRLPIRCRVLRGTSILACVVLTITVVSVCRLLLLLLLVTVRLLWSLTIPVLLITPTTTSFCRNA